MKNDHNLFVLSFQTIKKILTLLSTKLVQRTEKIIT
jgi:hypothetical protein